MPVHPARRPYTLPYARRKLASIEVQLAAWKATDCAGDWRKASDKRRALARLEAEWLRFDQALRPRPIEEYRLPF